MRSRAENILAFRRINMHGDKSHPYYEQLYHPGTDYLPLVMRKQHLMDEYLDMTQVHPFDSRWRISRDATTLTEVYNYPSRDRIYVSSIQSMYPGERTGGPTQHVMELLDLADKWNVGIEATAHAYGSHPGFLNQEQLEDWYRSFGIRVGDDPEFGLYGSSDNVWYEPRSR